jgi:hypothetical protein
MNLGIAPGINVQMNATRDPVEEISAGRITVTTPAGGGVQDSVDAQGEKEVTLLGPRLNLPIGEGTNLYVGSSWPLYDSRKGHELAKP